jgi:recombinational DNA repair ATPase RecF
LLNANRTADVARGYTHYGPSRGDFAVRLQHGAGLPSRGQTKLLVFYLQLGAQEFTDGLGGRRAIWLLDDLSAELDRPAARLILTELRATRDQIFVTTVGDRRTPEDHFPIRGGALFHVEQGRLAPPTCGHSAVK